MKNHIATFFALLLLAQGLSPLTGQLARIPALVTHFYTHHDHVHHEHGAELTFFDFLAQHYGAQAHHDDAGQEHSNLPFCGIDAPCAVLLLAVLSGFPLPDVTIVPLFGAKTAFGNATCHSSLFVRDIFRPPLG